MANLTQMISTEYGGVKKGFFFPIYEFQADGFKICLQDKQKDIVKVEVFCTPPFILEIRKRQISLNLGKLRKFDIPGLEEKLLCKTNAPERARAYFANTRNIKIIDEFMFGDEQMQGQVKSVTGRHLTLVESLSFREHSVVSFEPWSYVAALAEGMKQRAKERLSLLVEIAKTL